jgi:hypothetical protein
MGSLPLVQRQRVERLVTPGVIVPTDIAVDLDLGVRLCANAPIGWRMSRSSWNFGG